MRHRAASLHLVAYFTTENVAPQLLRANLARAVMKANSELGLGGVLLIKAQLEILIGGGTFRTVPEADPVLFEAIRLTAARGVTVVEATGNDGAPLDQFVDIRGKQC